MALGPPYNSISSFLTMTLVDGPTSSIGDIGKFNVNMSIFIFNSLHA